MAKTWLFWVVFNQILAIFPFTPRLSEPAYLDPGSGSFILQIILAALLGSLFVFKSFWQKVINFFRSIGKKSSKDVDSEEEK